MNLQTILDMSGGGPGSGCRGPNCGRPELPKNFAKMSAADRVKWLREHTQTGDKPKPQPKKEAEKVEPKDWKSLTAKKPVSDISREQAEIIKGTRPAGTPDLRPRATRVGEPYTREQKIDERIKRINDAESFARFKPTATPLEKPGAPKYNVNDLVKMNVPVKLWNDDKLWFDKPKTGLIGEIRAILPGFGHNPNVYEVFPMGLKQNQDIAKDKFYLKEDELSLHKHIEPVLNEVDPDIKPGARRGTVQQQVTLPNGAKYSMMKPFTGDKPESKLAQNAPPPRLGGMKVGGKNVAPLPESTWPEQAKWKGGEPSVQRSRFYGKFRYNAEDSFGSVKVYNAIKNKGGFGKAADESGVEIQVTRDRTKNDYSVKEFAHDAYGHIKFGSATSTRFRTPGSQQMYLQRRYGFNIERSGSKRQG